MTDKELRGLSRKDLMEMLLEQSREVQELRSRLASAEAALADRRIRLEQSGSMAEAALQLNGVFEAADAAAQQYLETLRTAAQRQETLRAQLEKEGRARADALIEAARKKAADMERETRSRCAELLAQARMEAAACRGTSDQ